MEEYQNIQEIQGYPKIPLGQAEDLRKYERFGKLIPLYRTTNKGKNTTWVFQCSCEKQTIIAVNACDVKKGHTKSCGCIQKACAAENGRQSAKDLTGRYFGYLEVIKKAEQRSNDGRIMWECYCHNCNTGGHIKIGHNLVQGNTKSCGCLNSLGEDEIKNLLQLYNIEFEREKVFESCKNKAGTHNLRFDFYIPKENYLIEFDGKQHYRADSGWGSDFNQIQERDNIKNQWCKKNKISLIRIPYTKLHKIKIEDLLLKTSEYIITKE